MLFSQVCLIPNFVLVPLCTLGVPTLGHGLVPVGGPVSSRGAQQGVSRLVSKLHLHLQLLSITHITPELHLLLGSAVALDSHRSGKPDCVCIIWKLSPDPTPGKDSTT